MSLSSKTISTAPILHQQSVVSADDDLMGYSAEQTQPSDTIIFGNNFGMNLSAQGTLTSSQAHSTSITAHPSDNGDAFLPSGPSDPSPFLNLDFQTALNEHYDFDINIASSDQASVDASVLITDDGPKDDDQTSSGLLSTSLPLDFYLPDFESSMHQTTTQVSLLINLHAMNHLTHSDKEFHLYR